MPRASRPAPRFCTRCGTPLADGACPRCGLVAAQPEPGRRRLVLLAIFILLVSALNFYGQQSQEPPQEGELPYVYSWTTAIGGALAYAFFLGIVFAFAAGFRWRSLFALRRPQSWSRAVAMMAVAAVGLLALSAVVELFLNAGAEQGVTPDRWVSGHTGAYVANLIVIAGLAPVVEELWFRGLAFSFLRSYGEWLAILTTGVSFGLIHGLWVGLPILIPFGIVLAYMRSRLDSIYPCILIHSLFNAFALLAVFLG